MNNTKRKVIALLYGGIGNQLFIYAAARRLAAVNDADLVLDNVNGFKRDFLHKRSYQLDKFAITGRLATAKERLEPFYRYRAVLKRRWNNFYKFADRDYLLEDGIGFDERLLDFNLKRDVYLHGYWQSERYFKDISDIIRTELQIIPPQDVTNLQLLEKIQARNSVALHLRFWNKEHLVASPILDRDYYLAAKKMLERLVAKPHYFIFCQEPKRAQELLGFDESEVTYVTHNNEDNLAYADLWLMTKCKHFIIPRSSFSWWGAWLADNPEKIVISPNIHVHNWLPRWRSTQGVLPDEWIKI